MMKTKQIKGILLLLLTAIIWGVAFVAQSAGMEYVGGFTFNCARFIIGAIVLIPFVFIFGKRQDNLPKSKGELKFLILSGIACGIILCVATNLQQFGIKYTTVGKAGFITAMYIVMVPVLGIFLKKKTGLKTWISVLLAAVGLYLLCMNESLSIGKGDLLVIMCAIIFAGHILVVDYVAPCVNGVALSCIQFFVAGIVSGVGMLLTESVSMQSLIDCAVPILYAGVLSCGVAYTLQIIGQQNMNPTAASMIMSLESVFSVIAGAVILHQMLSFKELIGCTFMFAAVIISQINIKNKNVA